MTNQGKSRHIFCHDCPGIRACVEQSSVRAAAEGQTSHSLVKFLEDA